MSDEENKQQFAIQKLYIKDVSYESPNAPEIFKDSKWQPEINLQINTEAKTIAENIHEVTLTVTVTAKQDDKTAFLVEVKQAGLFQLTGFEEEQMGGMLGAFCPETLFPFVRETVADLVAKGGFPQLMLTPINFNMLYMQHQEQKGKSAPAAETAH